MASPDQKLDAVVNMRIPSETLARFEQICAENGTRHTHLMRELVTAAIECHDRWGSLPKGIRIVQKPHPSAYEIQDERVLMAAEPEHPPDCASKRSPPAPSMKQAS